MILRAMQEMLPHAAALAARLWPEHTPEALLAELEELSPAEGAVFLAVEDDVPVGFAQCQLRHDYVEGASHSPVGYLEGIYVREEYRGRGTAKSLLSACEGWAAARGCLEFASDCEMENAGRIEFHLGAGFAEANRIVCFIKPLKDR